METPRGASRTRRSTARTCEALRQNVILPALQKEFGNQLLNLTFDTEREVLALLTEEPVVMGGARVPSMLEGLRASAGVRRAIRRGRRSTARPTRARGCPRRARRAPMCASP